MEPVTVLAAPQKVSFIESGGVRYHCFPSFEYNQDTMLKLACLALLVWPAFGQKKPITLDALYQRARGGADVPGAAIWAPDGKTFVYRQSAKLMLYDPSSKKAKDLIATDALDAAAMKPPAPERFGWENRRVREAPVQWS